MNHGNAKPSEPLNLENRLHRGDNWKQLKRHWTHCELAAKIDKETSPVRVATLLVKMAKTCLKLLH